jgi:hypothetical protein
MTDTITYKSLRVARRKSLRLAYQVLASTRRTNKRYNDGHSSKDIVKSFEKMRRGPYRVFAKLVQK